MPIRFGTVMADGRETAYMEAGDGPAVILSTGLGLTGRFYRQNLLAFAGAGLRLIVPAAPGLRRRGGTVLGMDVPETAEWLAAFARALGIDRAGLIGHSVGAQSAILLAAQRADLAAALVVVGPTGAPGRFRRVRELTALARTAPRESFGVLTSIAADYIRVSPMRYLGTWIKAGHDDPWRHARAVQCPALIVMGKRDPVPPRDYLDILRHALGNAKVEWIAGGAHGVTLERAAEFNRVAARFFGDVQRKGW